MFIAKTTSNVDFSVPDFGFKDQTEETKLRKSSWITFAHRQTISVPSSFVIATFTVLVFATVDKVTVAGPWYLLTAAMMGASYFFFKNVKDGGWNSPHVGWQSGVMMFL